MEQDNSIYAAVGSRIDSLMVLMMLMLDAWLMSGRLCTRKSFRAQIQK